MPEQPPDNPSPGAAPSGPPDRPDQPAPPTPPPPPADQPAADQPTAAQPAADTPPADSPAAPPPPPPGAGAPGAPGAPPGPDAPGMAGGDPSGPAPRAKRPPIVPIAIGVVVVLVLVVGGILVLGGGGDDGLSEEEQAYADALAAGFDSGGGNPPFTAEEASCVSEAMVQAMGLETLQGAGTPEELREDPDRLEANLDEGQANSFYDDFEDCVDVQEFFLSEFEGMGMPDEALACISDNLSDDLLRASLVAEFTGDDSASEEADAALEEALGPCEELAG